MDEREQRARAFVRRIKQNYPWLFSKKGNEQFYHAQMEVEEIDVLVDLARVGEKKALQIVRTRMRDLYEEGLREGRTSWEVPTSVSLLAMEILIYGPPKAKSGPKPTRSGQRFTTTALLVKWVNKFFGYPIYVNVEHRDNPDAPMSALRLVGEELGLDERRVEEIWADRKDTVERRTSLRP